MALLDYNPLNGGECEHGTCNSHMAPWKASALIIGVEIAERLAYSGISGNLVTYFSEALHESTATAARNVNIWSGVTYILPFIGAYLADSYLGRYKMILFSSLAYLLGLVLMSISAILSYSTFKGCFCFIALYMISVAQGGFKPCLQAFGADQFGDEDANDKGRKSSFFNWWYFGLSFGSLLGLSVLMYVDENVGWAVGFGIPAAFMALAVFLFICGTPIYIHKPPGGSPITSFICVFAATYHKWNIKTSQSDQNVRVSHGIGLRCLDKASIADEADDQFEGGKNWRLCTVEQVTEVKSVLCLFPVWAASLTYGIVTAQADTFFTKQGNTMSRKLERFEVPAASLQSIMLLTTFILIPVYDVIFVPLVRKLTGKERGITILQRIGTGLLISAISLVISALVEIKRLNAAKEYGLVDKPEETVPMSIFWLLPQYVLSGIADLFALVGMQEFFYEEMPAKMKSLGIAIYLSVLGVGSILSGALIPAIQYISCKYSSGCWISNNLNKGHLDYFYWFLAVFNTVDFCLFVILARFHVYRNVRELTVIHQALVS